MSATSRRLALQRQRSSWGARRERQALAWKLLRDFLDPAKAKLLLDFTYHAQPASLLGLQPVPVVAAQPALIRAPVQLPQPPVGALPAIRLADVHFGPVLGSGGFGSVHRGHLRGYPNEVAIKKLHLMGPLSQEHLKEFYKEAANLQALRHERLIQLIGIACEMPLLCIVTELAAGGSLHDLLHVKRLQLQEARSLGH
eukprot:g18813.t1